MSQLRTFLEGTRRKTDIIYTGQSTDHILPLTFLGKKYKSLENNQEGSRFSKGEYQDVEISLAKKVPLHTQLAHLHSRFIIKILS